MDLYVNFYSAPFSCIFRRKFFVVLGVFSVRFYACKPLKLVWKKTIYFERCSRKYARGWKKVELVNSYKITKTNGEIHRYKHI